MGSWLSTFSSPIRILPLRKSKAGGKEHVSLFLAICMCRQTLAADRVLDRKNAHIQGKLLLLALSNVTEYLFFFYTDFWELYWMTSCCSWLGAKQSHFRAVDCFQGDDITQSRWAPPRIVSLSHTPQPHRRRERACVQLVCPCVHGRVTI